MTKTKWYQKPICAMVALAFVLSLGIVAVPMAGTVKASGGTTYMVDASYTGTPGATINGMKWYPNFDSISRVYDNDVIYIAPGNEENYPGKESGGDTWVNIPFYGAKNVQIKGAGPDKTRIHLALVELGSRCVIEGIAFNGSYSSSS
jgi:hypothetical protein